MPCFTPGKWKVVSRYITSEIQRENSSVPTIANVDFDHSDYAFEEDHANARLIETAPDLYRLLVYVINNCDIWDKDVEREINSVLDYVDGVKGGETHD